MAYFGVRRYRKRTLIQSLRNGLRVSSYIEAGINNNVDFLGFFCIMDLRVKRIPEAFVTFDQELIFIAAFT
jgi:hypothetical protein